MLQSILTLIVNAAAGLLAGVMLLRFWMQVVRVRPPSSISQFLFQLSDWLIRPLRRVLPGVGGYDWASLVGAILVIILSVAISLLIRGFFSPEILLLLSIRRLFEWAIYGLILLLILEAIFSWVNPNAPLAPFVRAVNEPVLRPLRRVVPLVGNIDLSPLVALLLLQIALHVLSYLIPYSL